MRKPALLVAATAAAMLLLAVSTPAQAITDGVPDGDGHPNVGLMVAQTEEGEPMWRCSGTLISPTLYLTAGHCTSGAEKVEIWFDDDVRDAAAHDYPFTGDLSGMRGRISNQSMLGASQALIEAQAPLVELRDYHHKLKSQTAGEGSFTLEFSHYEAVPPRLQNELVTTFGKRRQEEAD